jgi:hypothetical protein
LLPHWIAHPGQIIICGGLGGQTDHLACQRAAACASVAGGRGGMRCVDGPETMRLPRGPAPRDYKIAGNPAIWFRCCPSVQTPKACETH